MNHTYSFKHLNLEELKTKEDLIIALSHHDQPSFSYSIRTAQFAFAIAKEMGFSGEELEEFYICGLYHDVGKLGMSRDFLNFPGVYSLEMYKEMTKHAEGGAELLAHVGAESFLIESTRHHHSNVDGTGYPGGLIGDRIPIHARVTRIADSVDAYLTKRCYKDGGPAAGAFLDVDQYAGRSYDVLLLSYFRLVHEKIMKFCHEYGNDRPSQSFYMDVLCVLYEPIISDPIVKTIQSK